MASTSSTVTNGESFFVGVIESIKAKGLRYMLVSVANVAIGGGLLLVLEKEMSAEIANVLSVLISSIPAYYFSRLWVWGKTGRSHFKKEVLPFWIFVIVGLVFSTLFISIAKNNGANSIETLLVQLGTFGVLWVLRFFLFDKLFHVEIAEDDTPDEV